ncbi:MAG: substrate-binding domain-containing protein [Planctomycetes bacterium]|nr:substrate-binding domain-containing protein [Planctomycetota bacterium]
MGKYGIRRAIMAVVLSCFTVMAAATAADGYKIGWSTIYLTPSWMQQTKRMMEDRIAYWKDQGVVSEFYIANANGDSTQQIAHIDNLVSQGYDAIIVVAGSSTALNNVIEKAHDKGVVILNFDSLVTTDKVTSKINTSQFEWGEKCAEWIAEKIGGSGEVIIFNGPAGVAVADERRNGALAALEKYPDITIATELFCEYNEGPAMGMIRPALTANPDVKGIISLGGAFSSASLKAIQQMGFDLIPITGENYNAFLKEWAKAKDDGFSSFCVGQPNWMGVLSIDQAIRKLQGQDVDAEVIVPLPIIDDSNLSDFVPNDFPDDGFPIKDIDQQQIDEYLKPQS